MERVFTVSTWLVLLAYLFFGVGGAEGAVLCVGVDGHVTVETPFRWSCNVFPDAPSRESTRSLTGNARSLTEDHCAPCVDLPVTASSHVQQFVATRNTSSQKQFAVLEDSSSAAPAFAGIAPENLPPSPPSVLDSMLVSLRTVIILV